MLLNLIFGYVGQLQYIRSLLPFPILQRIWTVQVYEHFRLGEVHHFLVYAGMRITSPTEKGYLLPQSDGHDSWSRSCLLLL
ncbi:hypothetical protein D3C74_384530 [compost metagenome]